MKYTEITLSQALIQCPSVTPEDAGALTLLANMVSDMGFETEFMPFSDHNTPTVNNLWAIKHGTQYQDAHAKHLCFAGHTDVVPVGNDENWRYDPFHATINDGILYGRGASDMKSAIAAFVIATQEFIAIKPNFSGTISLMITGDEEGVSINGTKKMVQTLQNRQTHIDHCIVGEPTNPETLGTMIKVGRRGSLNVDLTVKGTQGHVAYPHLANNPIPQLVHIFNALSQLKLDDGNDLFQPSNLELTNIDIGNKADNVIAQNAIGRFNIRFNSEWTGETVQEFIRNFIAQEAEKHGILYDLNFRLSGNSFITRSPELTDLLRDAIYQETGLKPELSTTGGTSDARFIKDLCPVVEFGIVGKTMHQVNEAVRTDDITRLKHIYLNFLQRYFHDTH